MTAVFIGDSNVHPDRARVGMTPAFLIIKTGIHLDRAGVGVAPGYPSLSATAPRHIPRPLLPQTHLHRTCSINSFACIHNCTGLDLPSAVTHIGLRSVAPTAVTALCTCTFALEVRRQKLVQLNVLAHLRMISGVIKCCSFLECPWEGVRDNHLSMYSRSAGVKHSDAAMTQQ